MQLTLILSFLFMKRVISMDNGPFTTKENEQCDTHIAGQRGVCRDPRSCEAFKTERNKLKICSFNHKAPIVCCPESIAVGQKVSSGKRISALKCEEYLAQRFPNRLARSFNNLHAYESNKSSDASLAVPPVVGGVRAAFNEFPHMSAIGWRRGVNAIEYLCGGSLVSEKFVLSAAHCASIGREYPEVIRVGDQDLLTDEEGIFPQDFVIKNIIVHPQYKRELKYQDIALFEFTYPARFTKDVSPACLSQDSIISEVDAIAMGYGQTSFAGPQSNALLKGYLKIVSNSECNKAYGDDSSDLPQGIIASHICAWDPAGKTDTCQGDSGGPLQIRIYEPYYIKDEIIGVTSFGKYCAAGSPGVYVRVSSYLDWIESIVWR